MLRAQEEEEEPANEERKASSEGGEKPGQHHVLSPMKPYRNREGGIGRVNAAARWSSKVKTENWPPEFTGGLDKSSFGGLKAIFE